MGTSFVKWAVEVKVKEIVLLLALDSSLRVDSQIEGNQNRIWFSENHTNKDSFKNWTELESNTIPDHFRTNAFPFNLQKECEKENIQLTILTGFCAEGQNLPDSGEMAGGFVSQYLSNSTIQSLKAPPSWNHIQGSPILRDSF